MTIECFSLHNGKNNLQLYNVIGQLILVEKREGVKGVNKIVINLERFSAAVYFLKINRIEFHTVQAHLD